MPALGNATQVAEPYLDTSPPTASSSSIVWTQTSFDVLHRVTKITKPDPTATNGIAITQVQYNNLITVTTGRLAVRL